MLINKFYIVNVENCYKYTSTFSPLPLSTSTSGIPRSLYLARMILRINARICAYERPEIVSTCGAANRQMRKAERELNKRQDGIGIKMLWPSALTLTRILLHHNLDDVAVRALHLDKLADQTAIYQQHHLGEIDILQSFIAGDLWQT